MRCQEEGRLHSMQDASEEIEHMAFEQDGLRTWSSGALGLRTTVEKVDEVALLVSAWGLSSLEVVQQVEKLA